jgi:hypothetical protein
MGGISPLNIVYYPVNQVITFKTGWEMVISTYLTNFLKPINGLGDDVI